MKARSQLTEDQIRQFLDRGFLVIKNCFDKDAGRAWMEKACTPLGYDLEDPATWRDEKIFLTNAFEISLKDFAPKAWSAIGELLGGEERVALRHGHGCALVINFSFGRDKPWEPPSASFGGHWHLDGPPTPRFLDGEDMGLLVFAVFSDVPTRAGGTYIACDSVAPVVRYLRDHPEGVSKFDIPIDEMLKECRDFVELTSEAGDVVLVHPQMAHASSWNHSGRPRLMTTWLIELESPLNFSRPSPEEYSPLERSILRAAGAPRIDFRRAAAACGGRPAKRGNADAKPPAGVASSIEIDPRVELISIVEALARGNPCPEGEPSAYLTRVLASFDAKHPAVARFARMSPPDWRWRHPSMAMLGLSAPPDLRAAAGAGRDGSRGNEDGAEPFFSELRAFARDAGFAQFFAREKEAYDSFLEPAKESFLGLDYWTAAREYLGFCPEHRYHFVMAPLYHGPALHNTVSRAEDGSFDFHSISGHLKTAGGLPVLCDAELGYRHILWHELARAAVLDVVLSRRPELEGLSSLRMLAAAPGKLRFPGLDGWLHLIAESFARAATIRMLATFTDFTESGGSGRAQAAMEKTRGYILVGPIYELLLEYEKTRDRHPTVREFFPRIVEVLTALDSRLRPHPGTPPRA